MRKPWSISTTVRNAERIGPFLEVLIEMEGEEFDEQGQIKYQTMLIQHKLYQPIHLPKNLLKYYENPDEQMTYSQAGEIFDFMRSKSEELDSDPGLRGRTSVAPLAKMGLCIAKKKMGKVKITELGRAFLEERIELGEVYFKFFLKWQYPNPDSDDFKSIDGFSIKPFVGVLHLINEVNQKWKKAGYDPVGISKEEFSLFAPTLINYKDISTQAEEVISFRKKAKKFREQKELKETYKRKFAEQFLDTKNANAIDKLLSNLKDYGDNAIRYFRLTKYIYIRGGGFYIDLEPRRSVELELLLKTDKAAPLSFKDLEEYLGYIADINRPILPWETEHELKQIVKNLMNDINGYEKDFDEKKIKISEYKYKKIESLQKDELKQYIEELRKYRRKLQEVEKHHESQNEKAIEGYIFLLKNIHKSKSKQSIELERLVSLALKALNDALEIQPNYPVGDDNEPTFTAPANKPDIECFYDKFNSVCEVTMLSDRSQWYNEGQPVMRHVRDFEKKYTDKQVYCVFVAPRLHQDTLETFWMSIKYGYKGSCQKIVPLSITQFIVLLEVLLELKKKKKQLKHLELLELYESILIITGTVEHSDLWVQKIPEAIQVWKDSLLS